jgi:hypothetical protein
MLIGFCKPLRERWCGKTDECEKTEGSDHGNSGGMDEKLSESKAQPSLKVLKEC